MGRFAEYEEWFIEFSRPYLIVINLINNEKILFKPL
jgi:hypothetical protein